MSCVEGETCPTKGETCCDVDNHLLLCKKVKGVLRWWWDGSSLCDGGDGDGDGGGDGNSQQCFCLPWLMR